MQKFDNKINSSIMKSEILEQFRCPHCNALIFQHNSYIGVIEVKCYRCGKFTKKTFDVII